MRKPIKSFTLILLIVIILFSGGCFEEESEYTINPDFSGKATFNLVFTPSGINSRKSDATLQDLIKPSIEEILQRSKGIETWKDISFEFTDEGSVRFVGTAYFRNVNEAFLWRSGIPEDNGLLFSKDSSGRINIEVTNLPNPERDGEKKAAVTLSDAELAQKIKLTKLQYNQSRPLMQATLGNLKSDSLLHLPAKIEKISSFEKVDDSTIRIKWQGSKVIEAIDRIIEDDEQLKQLILEGRNPFDDIPDELLYNAIVFGREGPIEVVLSSDSEELFDYDAEVADAKSNYDKMLEELGLFLPKTERAIEAPVVSSISVEPGKVRVGGIRLVRYSNSKREIRPLNEFKNGYTLSLILDLPEPNLILAKGHVEKANTDTGQNILSEPEYNRETSFPVLSKDGNTAVFSVNLSVPDKEAKGIAELSGTLGYLKSTGTKKIDLGIMEFVDGAESQVEGFYIQSVKTYRWNRGNSEVDLHVDLLRGHLISTRFYREDGTEIKISPNGRSYSGGELFSISYTTRGKFPPKGRIVFEVIDEITRHEINFSLTNISLTGEPL